MATIDNLRLSVGLRLPHQIPWDAVGRRPHAGDVDRRPHGMAIPRMAGTHHSCRARPPTVTPRPQRGHARIGPRQASGMDGGVLSAVHREHRHPGRRRLRSPFAIFMTGPSDSAPTMAAITRYPTPWTDGVGRFISCFTHPPESPAQSGDILDQPGVVLGQGRRTRSGCWWWAPGDE